MATSLVENGYKLPHVVPKVALIAQPLEALPKSPPAVPLNRLVQGVYDRRIPLDPVGWLPIQRRPRQACNAAGLGFRQSVFVHHHLDCRTLR
jgi:hypothetical protein